MEKDELSSVAYVLQIMELVREGLDNIETGVKIGRLNPTDKEVILRDLDSLRDELFNIPAW